VFSKAFIRFESRSVSSGSPFNPFEFVVSGTPEYSLALQHSSQCLPLFVPITDVKFRFHFQILHPLRRYDQAQSNCP
jgi:hypothetical protein